MQAGISVLFDLLRLERQIMLKYVFFYGWEVTKDCPISRACFSQWYDAAFEDPERPGTVFKTAEHWFMFHKARLFDPDLCDKIIAADTPDEAKKLGRQVKNFDRKEWDKYADQVVQKGNELKFAQHADLRRYLFDTGSRTLVEAAPTDRIWGIGFSEDEAMDHVKEWGTNRMGLALTRARD
ncbi:hypothetical protein BD324DRAFT_680209, partial [Kockovaella imperatae]